MTISEPVRSVSALVIIPLVSIAGVFFRKLMTSSAGRKRDTVSAIPDTFCISQL